MVARQGGDEFLVLLADIEPNGNEDDPEYVRKAAAVVARKIRRTLLAPFVVSGVEIFVSASMGVSLFPDDAPDSETLLKHADTAMYRAKDAGRDCHALYALDRDDALTQLSMAGRLRTAIERGDGLVLHYQPLVRLDSAEIIGAEALIRWRRRTSGAAGRFPPARRANGLHGASLGLGDCGGVPTGEALARP